MELLLRIAQVIVPVFFSWPWASPMPAACGPT